eukprot:3651696-Rhodomonas_salina.1
MMTCPSPCRAPPAPCTAESRKHLSGSSKRIRDINIRHGAAGSSGNRRGCAKEREAREKERREGRVLDLDVAGLDEQAEEQPSLVAAQLTSGQTTHSKS